MKVQLKAKKNGNKKLINNRNPSFTRLLMQWNSSENTREMPWKGEKDVYKIWLSEIILQQTKVEQGLEYYHRFLKKFPTIHHLAEAKEEQVFKLWEGLGYYARCKNLITTARYISKEHHGKFPTSFEEIKALKGVGQYTASAIASFGHNLPYAVLDGNVYRVIARFFGIGLPIQSTEGKRHFLNLAQQLLDRKQPGSYNQAIMDFGAVVCKPRSPACNKCVLSRHCVAFQNETVSDFPVKKASSKKNVRWLYYYVIEYNGKVYIKKRTEQDIWQNLYEFALLDSEIAIAKTELRKQGFIKELLIRVPFQIHNITEVYSQQLSHLRIYGQFIHVKISSMPVSLNHFRLVAWRDLRKFAFPKFILSYLQEKNVNLS
jgi:A/G-specific adenine glycosylase